MALRGTLGDFGIADIFQLVGHQGKTGVLQLKNRELEVRIYFVDGNVVKGEQSSRQKKELLGNLLVRADVITETQLEEALTQQQRTLRRLGDILVDTGYLERKTLRDFTRLQTTETIYRLFEWKAGTYEFVQQDVEYDEQSYEPIRAENILMEGFRMVDEWPAVREVIPHNQVTLEVLKDLPGESGGAASEDEDLLAGIDDAFAEWEDKDKSSAKDADPSVGPSERAVFALVAPDRTVEEITDRSRMGEFETSKSLANLVRSGYLAVVVTGDAPELPGVGAEPSRSLAETVVPLLTRVALYAVVAAATGGVVKLLELNDSGLLARDRAQRVRDRQIQSALGEVQLQRVRSAVEVHRLLEGSYPETLEALVVGGLLEESDLRFPYREAPSYKKTETGYALAPALR
jgi:hypothetical protein